MSGSKMMELFPIHDHYMYVDPPHYLRCVMYVSPSKCMNDKGGGQATEMHSCKGAHDCIVVHDCSEAHGCAGAYGGLHAGTWLYIQASGSR